MLSGPVRRAHAARCSANPHPESPLPQPFLPEGARESSGAAIELASAQTARDLTRCLPRPHIVEQT